MDLEEEGPIGVAETENNNMIQYEGIEEADEVSMLKDGDKEKRTSV